MSIPSSDDEAATETGRIDETTPLVEPIGPTRIFESDATVQVDPPQLDPPRFEPPQLEPPQFEPTKLMAPEADAQFAVGPERPEIRMRTVVLGFLLLVVAVIVLVTQLSKTDVDFGVVGLGVMICCGLLLVVGARRP